MKIIIILILLILLYNNTIIIIINNIITYLKQSICIHNTYYTTIPIILNNTRVL